MGGLGDVVFEHSRDIFLCTMLASIVQGYQILE